MFFFIFLKNRYGSNLTESGTLEMDAGLMDGSNLLFGAVGAITEIKNPIRVARKLVDEQARGTLIFFSIVVSPLFCLRSPFYIFNVRCYFIFAHLVLTDI